MTCACVKRVPFEQISQRGYRYRYAPWCSFRTNDFIILIDEYIKTKCTKMVPRNGYKMNIACLAEDAFLVVFFNYSVHDIGNV